ncbi:LacI family DNA-binding transcriptional regulator [Erythrobacteraceae bacterium E2-1 Yellow Sea]|nr:LacI family DNA-binding transcriptional regulator [Erythrobacteraceae bacterium E2-1 Yellow Sea]
MTRQANITIEDVAEAAGVSRQTVSRVINNGPNVKQAVREKVEAAIAQLGYVPNLSARRMGGGKSYLILAVNDRQRTLDNWQAGRGNDWVDQMLYGGMTECEKHGYHLVFRLIDTDTESGIAQLSQVIASLRPDGVLLTPPHCDNEELVALLANRSIPCARVGQHDSADQINVFMDEAGAAAEATRYLLELGHRRLAFVAGSPEYGNSRRRVQGFREVLAKAGQPEETGLILDGDFRFDRAVEEIDKALASENRPTAIIADNDEMAFAALHTADRHGLSVPEQLSVISFEDTPGVRFSVPPLTAIKQPTAQMIARACEKLIATARGENGSGNFELPYELVKRATTAPPDD